MPQTIGIVGLGFLGRGIAACLLAHRFDVIALDPHFTPDTDREIHSALQELLDHNEITAQTLANWRTHFRATQSLSDFSPCDFVIESVSELPALKQQLFTQLEPHLRPDIPLVSNTSSIPISLMQSWLKHPNRFAGMHFAGPAHIYRFMEIVRGNQTDDATLAAVIDLAQRLGKDPAILQRDVPGFIVNRLCYAMYREAFHLLESGIADIDSIDKSFRNVVGDWASIAGPFRWMDLTGGSVYANGIRQIFPTLSNSTDLPKTILDLESAAARGTQNLHGFYPYTEADAQRWNDLLNQQIWQSRDVQKKLEPPS